MPSKAIMTSHGLHFRFDLVVHVLQLDVFLHCDVKRKKMTVINTYLSYMNQL